MDEDIYNLHLKEGISIDKDRTCCNKTNYKSEEKAIDAAEQMNGKPNTRNILEAYPCAFCQGWHIGRAMARAELESYLDGCM